MSAVTSCVAVKTSEWLTEVFANLVVMVTETSQQYPFHPLTSTAISMIGLNYSGGVFWERTRGRTVKNTEAIITKSTTVFSRSKTKSFFLLSPLSQLARWHHQWVSDQSLELGSKSTEWGLSIISCAYCTPWEGNKQPDKEAQVTQTTRRLFLRVDEGKQICHQQAAATKQMNHKWVS